MYTASKDRYTAMDYNRCGKSSLLLPKVSLGLWHNFGDTYFKSTINRSYYNF